MQPSPKLTKLVKALFAKHNIDWQSDRVCLHLQMAGMETYLAIENLGGERVSIGLYVVCEGHILPEIEIVLWHGFQLELVEECEQTASWAAIEKVILYEGARQYVDLNENGEVESCFDPVGQAQLSRFADDWSEELLNKGWLDQGVAVEGVPEPLPHRIPGCQSSNHTECYGELWQCASCGKMVCYAEGTDNLPELCDDCWVEAQDEMGRSLPEIASSIRHVTTVSEEEVRTSCAMQLVIEEIAAKHNVDLSYYLAFLWLEKPEGDKRLIIERIDDFNISIALACDDDGTGRTIPDLDMIFLTLESGWVPEQVFCSPVEWTAYLSIRPADEHALPDQIMPEQYLAFAEYWARRIREEDWLEEGVPQAEPPWEVQEDGRWHGVFQPHCDNFVDSEQEENDIPF